MDGGGGGGWGDKGGEGVEMERVEGGGRGWGIQGFIVVFFFKQKTAYEIHQ